jgi:hypothetical protein
MSPEQFQAERVANGYFPVASTAGAPLGGVQCRWFVLQTFLATVVNYVTL